MKKLLSFALALALCVFLVGCSGSSSPEKAADTFLSALKAEDFETLATVYDGDVEDIEENTNGFVSDELDALLMEKILGFDYVLSNEQIDGETATVDVEITTYSSGKAMMSAMSEYFHQVMDMAAEEGTTEDDFEEAVNTILTEKFSDLTEKDYTTDVTLELEQVDGEWKVAEFYDFDFLDALYGGIFTTISNIQDGIIEDVED